MDDTRLQTLLTLVRLKSYTNTARELFITQPAVTHHIKSLEHEYNIKIFCQDKRFELTSQGYILLEYARRMINSTIQLRQALEDSLNSTKVLALGVTTSCSIILTKLRLLEVIFKYYNSEAKIMIMDNKTIFKELKSGKLDFAVVDNAYDEDEFEAYNLATYSIVPACFKDGKFKEIKRVTREMLRNNPLVLGLQGEGLYEATTIAFKQANINLAKSTLLQANSPMTMAQMIEVKDGIGFMYLDSIERYENIKRMDLINFKASQTVSLIYSQDSYDKPKIKEMLKDLKRWKVE